MMLETYIDIDALCHSQMLILPKSIQMFGKDEIVAAKEELKQMHGRFFSMQCLFTS